MIESYISEKEREVIDKLIEGKSLSEASRELHVSKQAVVMRMRTLRDRYRKAKEFIEKYEELRAKIPPRYM